MDINKRTAKTRKGYFEFTRLYRLEKWTLEQVKQDFEERPPNSNIRQTANQWKMMFDELNIFKNMNPEEKVYIKSGLATASGRWSRLFIIGDVLFENPEVDALCQRTRVRDDPEVPSRRHVWFFDLPFDFDTLEDSDTFKNFQRLLFYAKVHFEDSFTRGLWGPDSRGIYARSVTLQSELKRLNEQHNLMFHALRKFKEGNTPTAWALVRNAFIMQRHIIQNKHHRQFHDILAILYMLHRAGQYSIQRSMAKDLLAWAKKLLQKNDPRRMMFQCLWEVPLDEIRTHYIAFDTYCRDLWAQVIGHGDMESYSYNQASFPRAYRPRFYSMYEGKPLSEIKRTLDWADATLGGYSSEAFCFWLTALNYLWSDERLEDLLTIGQILSYRLDILHSFSGRTGYEQLNVDAALAFYLLGRAQEAQGYIEYAREAYVSSVNLRSQLISCDTWDPTRAVSLERLAFLASRVRDLCAWNYWNHMLLRMYGAIQAKDIEQEKEFRLWQLRHSQG